MEEPIGVFDSGLGGISVLAQMIIALPHEKYLYFGDSRNAPYGEKTKKEVLNYSMEITQRLINQSAKAMVLACNTATSAAIEELRRTYDIPIIGMEPAVKPANMMKNINRIVVMATPFTLKEKKFRDLVQNIDTNKRIVKLPCPGLVQLIEQEGGAGPRVFDYLMKLFQENIINKGDVLVLGCTHYVFLSEVIHLILGDKVPLVHGNKGTVRELNNQLERYGILAEGSIKKSKTRNKDKTASSFEIDALRKRITIMNSNEDPQFNEIGWNLLMYEVKKLLKKESSYISI